MGQQNGSFVLENGFERKVIMKVKVGFLAILTLLTAACESDEDRAVSQAQECLNRSTQATVNSCASYVEGFSSEKAYAIRCSINFIAEGFSDPTKLTNAVNAMNDSSGSSSPMLGLLGQISFTSEAAANQAFSNCSLSGSDGMKVLAAFVKMATTLNMAVGGAGAAKTPEDLAAAIQSNAGDASLGAAVLAAESVYCKEGSSTYDSQPCQDMRAATANNSDPTAVGFLLRCAMAADGATPTPPPGYDPCPPKT